MRPSSIRSRSSTLSQGLFARSLWTLVLGVGLLALTPCFAGGHDVVLDVSGSMQGYAAGKSIAWRDVLSGFEAGARNLYQFGDRGRFRRIEGASLATLPLQDNTTMLGDALARWIDLTHDGDTVLVITDNQAAPGGNDDAAREQRQFEEVLTAADSQFSHVGVFAMRLPFSGTVWSPDATKFAQYKGDRALVAYLLGRRGVSNAAFSNLVGDIEKTLAAREHRYFQVRPVDPAAVASNMGDIKVNPTGKQGVAVAFRDQRLWITGYQLGEPLELTFQADIQTPSNALLMRDVALDVALQFEHRPDLTAAETKEGPISAVVKPDVATFTPNKISNFNIFFRIDRFGFFSQPFSDKLRYAMHDSTRIEGQMDLRFRATKDSFALTQETLNEWSFEGTPGDLGTKSPTVQRRVYRLGATIGNLIQQQVPVQTLKSIPVSLDVSFSLRPLIVIVAMVAVAGALLTFLIRSLNRNSDFILDPDFEDPIRFSAGLGHSYPYYGANDTKLFSLRNLGFGFLVSTPHKLRSSRIAAPGSTIKITDTTRDEGEDFEVRINRSTGRPPDVPGWE